MLLIARPRQATLEENVRKTSQATPTTNQSDAFLPCDHEDHHPHPHYRCAEQVQGTMRRLHFGLIDPAVQREHGAGDFQTVCPTHLIKDIFCFITLAF